MNPEADRIVAKSYRRGDEEEQIKSQEGTWVWDDVLVIWTCPSCGFFSGVAFWASNFFCGTEVLWSSTGTMPLQLPQHLAIIHHYCLNFRIQEHDLTKYTLSGGSFVHCLCKKTNKRVFYQRLSTAQQHPEQPGTARGRDLLWLPTDSFQFENKYWMLWLRVVYNAAHNMR